MLDQRETQIVSLKVEVQWEKYVFKNDFSTLKMSRIEERYNIVAQMLETVKEISNVSFKI